MDDRQLRRALGLVIRERRTALRYSQALFAQEFGLHRTQFGAVERGERNLTLRMLCTIAHGLETTPAELLTEAQAKLPT